MMGKAIEILKSLLLPFLMDSNKSIDSLNINWDKLLQVFINYNNDPNVLQKELSALPFNNNSKKLLTELPEIYDTFMEELAEDYALGNHSELTDNLLRTNTSFKDKVTYYNLIKGVITKMERKRIIDNLKAVEVISEKDIEIAFKKKGREDLKAKFKEWDTELVEEKSEFALVEEFKSVKYSPRHNISTEPLKDVSLWQKYAKYAVAATIALLIGIFYFTSENTITDATKIKYAKTSGEKVKILTNKGLGFTDPSAKKEITVVFISSTKDLSPSSYKYINDTLQLFQNKPKEKITLLELENNLYLKINDSFYTLKETQSPTVLQKLNNDNQKKQLKRIIFDNR